MGRHSDTVSLAQLENLFKLIYAGQFPYLVIVSITKTSILLFYLRLFGTPGTHQVFRKLLYITQALVVIWFIASVVPGIVRCHPIKDMWNPLVVGSPDVRHYCINTNAYYVSTSAFNVALDFWILVLPISIVWTLQLSGRRKVGLSAIFLLGGLICGASIARAYTVANVGLSDFPYDASPSIIWSSVEISVGIICACLPTVQPVLQIIRRMVRNVTPQPRTRRESSSLWCSASVARENHQKNNRDQDGIDGTSDEELATLRPAYNNSKWVSERIGTRYGTEGNDDNKGMPVTTIRSNSSSNWWIANTDQASGTASASI
ncbi:MAG: hypothetical protein Q9175_007847 [Cornicularia normoerica]